MRTITELSDGTILLTAPVMIPNARDCDYENGEPPLTKEQIRDFAKSYEQYGFIDHEHGLTRNGETIGEVHKSYLLTEDTTMTLLDGSLKSYPAGSWFVTSKLTDPGAIDTARSGGYTGYSASVFTKSRADEYLNALKSEPGTPLPCACKDVSSSGNSLIVDVPDPVVLSVSLVNSPCLHDSKFCELRGDMMENQEDVKSLKSKVLSAMGMSEEAEVVALKSEVETLQSEINSLKTEFQEALKSMQEEFKQTLNDALTPVDDVDDSEALKAKEEKEEDEAEEKEETESESQEDEEKESEEEPDEEKEEKDDDEEKVAKKGESKAEPIHDNTAEKSKKLNLYSFMGRNPDGTRKK